MVFLKDAHQIIAVIYVRIRGKIQFGPKRYRVNLKHAMRNETSETITHYSLMKFWEEEKIIYNIRKCFCNKRHRSTQKVEVKDVRKRFSNRRKSIS